MEFRVVCAEDKFRGAVCFVNSCVQEDADVGGAAFFFEHPQHVAGGTVAEQLPERLLVIRNAVPLNQCDEIGRRLAGQRGLGEMRVGREEVLGLAVEVGEIAAAAARDEDLLAEAVGMVEEGDAASALAGLEGAHEARCTTAENQCVEMMDHVGVNSLPQRTGWSESVSQPWTRIESAVGCVTTFRVILYQSDSGRIPGT